MTADNDKVVLITGCSTGIGRALALEMAGRGWRVFASARRAGSIDDLSSDSIETLILDVTDIDAIRRAVSAVIERAGRIDMLVNNAGYGLMGPMAELPLDDLRLQFETNVIGPVALIQEVAPLMAARNSGRIVNVGSVSGITATPYSGAYCASKAAVHLMSDALRMELKPFGIDVIQLHPGGVKSSFGKNSATNLNRYRTESSLYRKAAEGIDDRAAMSQGSPTSVEEFARQVADAITRKRPTHVFRNGRGAILMPFLKYALPTRWLDRIFSRKFKLDRLA